MPVWDNNWRTSKGLVHNVKQKSLFYLIINNDFPARFIGNRAKLRGGAIYIDFDFDATHCAAFQSWFRKVEIYIITSNVSKIISKINSWYIMIRRWDKATDFSSNSNDSVYYIPSRLNYTQPLGAIATSPYKVNLCSSASCDLTKDNCFISEPNMLGHPMYFSATCVWLL